jgi:hypothetical protein
MKAIRNLATLAAVTMLAIAFSSVRANAQGVVRGTFKLAFQARWGTTSLAPGRYHFEVFGPEGAGNEAREVMVWSRNNEGDDPTYHILGVLGDPPSSTAKNELQCQCRGEVCVVRKLQLALAGETLTFTAPKSENIGREARGRKNHTQRRQKAAAIETVPIVMSGK